MVMKEFVSGERLFAADLNDNFDETQLAANILSGTFDLERIPNLDEGRIPDLAASKITSGTLASTLLPAGSIVKVAQSVKTDTFSSSSSSFVEVTGVSASITPASATNKILVVCQISYATKNADGPIFKVTRAGTDIYRGDAAGSRTRAVFGGNSTTDMERHLLPGIIVYLDSPDTTSSTTYRLEMAAPDGTGHVNRPQDDADQARRVRGASSITLVEVVA
jgi:hypothetical protein